MISIWFIVGSAVLILAIIVVEYFVLKRIIQQPVREDNKKVLQERAEIEQELLVNQNELKNVKQQIFEAQKRTSELDRSIRDKEKLFQHYTDSMEENLQQKKDAYIAELQRKAAEEVFSINKKKEELHDEIQKTQSELVSLQNTRAAIIEAHRREEELNNNDFYVLQIPEDELDDIHYLERIKIKLHFPIIIGKVIWTTFIQKKVNNLAARVLPQKDTVGIYKITNLNTSECYIGQSVNVRQRWIDHCKAGIGAVESSASNKLYAAMRQDGIESFAFELLEECDKDQLNEKERYYINLYNSDTLGYNSNSGVKN